MSDASRLDPASPSGVSNASFSTARKGFDQREVRDFLRRVADELGQARERAGRLEQELQAAREQAQAVEPVALDEDTVTRMLGEEAARILQTSRESGATIKARAEEGAARLLREASEEASRLRQEADLEIARRRHEAAADVDAELALAKQQGREMVEEARAYRERVLGELARRRELARQQINQLVRSRDRLVQAFERARLAAADVIAEVAPLEAPDDDLDLSPTTGPIPITRPTSPDQSAVGPAALPGETDAGADRGVMYDREDEGEDAARTAAAAPDVDDDDWVEELLDDRAEDDGGDAEAVPAEPEPDTTGDEVSGGDSEAAGESAEPAEEQEATPDDRPDATIVQFPGAAPAPPAAAVDDLFARIRADADVTGDEPTDQIEAVPADAGPEPVAATEPEESTDTDTETAFSAREAALVPVIVAAARKVKRVLADEQNDVLDALRRNDKVTSVDEIVVAEAEQADRYRTAIAAELDAAATAGAASTSGDGPADVAAAASAAGAMLAETLVGPLRERLARAVADADGDNEALVKRVRAVYREWKTQRIDEQLDDLFRTAYARAAFEAFPPGTQVTWIVDPDGPPSPDCEDNSLVGAVVVGDTFPTGHAYPPAHPGCRCLLTRVQG